MKRHLNLMSRRSRVRISIRTRLRQWTTVLAALAALLAPTWFVFWWPVHQQGQHTAALDVKLEPYRQMNQASKGFQNNIARVRAQEKTALALAQIDTPVVTLLGMISKAIANHQGRVVIENLEFHQSAAVLSEHAPKHEANVQISIDIEGLGIDADSVNRLANEFRSALPFADVQIKSSEPQHINQQPMQLFFIQCAF